MRSLLDSFALALAPSALHANHALVQQYGSPTSTPGQLAARVYDVAAALVVESHKRHEAAQAHCGLCQREGVRLPGAEEGR
jgi:hypothetical protein